MRRSILRPAALLLISFIVLASIMLPPAMAHIPPKICYVTRSPETPNYDQSVTVTTQVIQKTNPIESVILRYKINSGSWNEVTMNLEGEVYVAEIPAQPYGTTVTYKVYAYDICGYYSRSDYCSYVVGDFVPPVISNILYVPTSPMPFEEVTVSAIVTEPPEASGVKNVVLKYKVDDGEWSCIEMTLHEGVWNATIPGQSGGATVKFLIKAYDNAYNCAVSPTFDYTVVVPNEPPVAFFTESAESVFTGVSISFDASGSYDPDGTIVSYEWDFGDGNTGAGVTIEHAYSEEGTFTVTLTVTDDDGATDTAEAIKTVLNQSPVASFTESAETVLTGEAIDFNASDSYDPDGSIISYEWDFGDGTTGSGVTVSHSYGDNGIYTVILTVTDDEEATDTAQAVKTVLNREPVALFTESAESVFTGVSISFDASGSYDPDGTIVSYEWDFGDGTTGNGVTISHAYSQIGIYIVTLVVVDDDGATDMTSATKTVSTPPSPPAAQNQGPVASFTETAEIVYTGEAIQFDASASFDPDGTIVSYEWDFGDEIAATGVTAEHAYSEDGNYTVTLTVTDNAGATDTATATKTVLNQEPVALFTETAETVYIDEAIGFDAAESNDPDGTIVSYEWDFGDGNTGAGVTIEHAYSEEGTFTVTLTVTDDDGATNNATATKTVLTQPPANQQPIASFTESAETVNTDESIQFDASGSYDPDGTIVTYRWNFGDGTTGSGVTVSHNYSDDGIYHVTLTVTDNDGATDSAIATKTVLNRQPVASFTGSAGTVYPDVIVDFDASGSYDHDGTIVSYEWDFGDGTTTTGVEVGHSYDESGTYTITLTITDDDGATDTFTATKIVVDVPNHGPVASFTESAEIANTGVNIHFDATESNDPDGTIVSYEWDFGDENTAVGVEVDHAYQDDGTYTVTLTVIDDDGASDTTTSTKTILNRPPIATFTENATTVSIGDFIHFDASHSYDPDGTIVSYEWDFGDGTTATGVTAEHAYGEEGEYTVTLTVTDDDGASSLDTAEKMVEEEVESDGVLSLSFIAAIGLGIAALTWTLLYGLFRRRKKKKRSEV